MQRKGPFRTVLDRRKVSLELQVCSYYDGNLAVLLSDWNNGEPEPWGDLTVNLGMTMEKNCAFLDINQLGEEIQTWVEKIVWGLLQAEWNAADLSFIRNTALIRNG